MMTDVPRSIAETPGFDPICGSRLPALYRVNPYSDDQVTYFFCSEACRRFFVEHSQLASSAHRALDRGKPRTDRGAS